MLKSWNSIYIRIKVERKLQARNYLATKSSEGFIEEIQ